MAEQRDDVSPDPTPEHLERTATPARLRRAPRYRAFAVTGALLAAVVGGALVLLTGEATADRGPALIVVTLGATVLGAILGGLVAVLLDRR